MLVALTPGISARESPVGCTYPARVRVTGPETPQVWSAVTADARVKKLVAPVPLESTV